MIDVEKFCQQVETSLQTAVTNTLETKRRLGQYAVIVEDGKPRRIGPDEIGALLERHNPCKFTDSPLH